MGYEHLSITPETEYDEVTESNAENLLPILSKCEVTLEDEIECDMPAKDVCSPVFTTFSNPLFKDNDNFDSSDDESLPDEDVPAEEFKIYSNPLCDEDKINSDRLDLHCFNDEIDIVTDDVLPPSVENDDDDYDFLLEEVDLFLSDNSIPPGIENVADDPEGDIHFLEELLIDDSILSHELFDFNFEDNPSISRPPPEPPDDNFDLEPEVISAVMEDIDEPDEHFNPGGEIFVFTNNEDVDYFPFMFVILIFLPYLILPEISPLFLSAESEDMIFYPVYDESFEDIEYVDASVPDPTIVSVEEENVVQQEEKEERLINLMENDNSDSSNDPFLEEADLFLDDNSIPPGIENFADDPEGDICFLEELLIDDSILSHESFDSSFEDSLLIPRPPPEPPDVETDVGEEISVVMNDKDEDVDYSSFKFVIYPKMFSFLLSAESEDTIFDLVFYLVVVLFVFMVYKQDYPSEIEVILCWIYVRFPRSSYPLIDFSLGSMGHGIYLRYMIPAFAYVLAYPDFCICLCPRVP
nr:hypothetical protein [Tanacetum cinerariifolium]